MKYLAPFLVPICYVLGIICLVLAFANRDAGTAIFVILIFCAVFCFIFGYSTDKNNKYEKKWNHFSNRIETESEIYSMVMRFDNNKIIGYQGVPMLNAATELDVIEENNRFALYHQGQSLGYLEEDTPTHRMLNAYYPRKDFMIKAIIKKDGDHTVDIAAYQC